MNDRQKRFVLEYLVDGNATAAYLRAGYKATKRSTAEVCASQLLRNPQVAEEVEREQERQGKRIKATADRALLEIESIALVNLAEFSKVKTLAQLRRLPVRLQRAVTGWTWTKTGRLVLKFAKEAMLGKLGTHHGLLKERVEVSGTLTLEQILSAASKPEASK